MTGVLCVLAAAAPTDRLFRAALIASVASVLLSVISTVLPIPLRPEHDPGATELAALLLVTYRSCTVLTPARAATVNTAATSAAALLLFRTPAKFSDPHFGDIETAVLALCTLALAAGVGLRLHRRSSRRAGSSAA